MMSMRGYDRCARRPKLHGAPRGSVTLREAPHHSLEPLRGEAPRHSTGPARRSARLCEAPQQPTRLREALCSMRFRQAASCTLCGDNKSPRMRERCGDASEIQCASSTCEERAREMDARQVPTPRPRRFEPSALSPRVDLLQMRVNQRSGIITWDRQQNASNNHTERAGGWDWVPAIPGRQPCKVKSGRLPPNPA